MAESRLDLTHPYFQKSIKKLKDDPTVMEALEGAKRLIEANHEACHRVVQNGLSKYPQCQNKIWKYDWQPTNVRSSGRKSWRMVAIVPEPFKQPCHIIAAALYSKADVEQLTAKQLAVIFSAVTTAMSEETTEPEPTFKRVSNGDGRKRSLCLTCGDSVSVSAVDQELQDGENKHQCPGPVF